MELTLKLKKLSISKNKTFRRYFKMRPDNAKELRIIYDKLKKKLQMPSNKKKTSKPNKKSHL